MPFRPLTPLFQRTLALFAVMALSLVTPGFADDNHWRSRRTLLVGHERYVTQVAFSPDGRTIASGDDIGARILLWQTGDALTTRYTVADPLCQGAIPLGFSGDGRLICITRTQPNGKIVAVDLERQKAVALGEGSLPANVSFDGRWLAAREPVSGLMTGFGLWDLKTNEKVATLFPPAPAAMTVRVLQQVMFRSDSQVVVGQFSDHSIHVWDLNTKSLQRSLGRGAAVRLDFDLGGNVVPAPLNPPQDAERLVREMAYSPDRATVATLYPRSLSITEHVSGRVLASCPTSSARFDRLACVRFSPDGKLVAATDQHGPLVLNVATGQSWSCRRRPGNVRSLTYRPDGSRLASARGNVIELWDTAMPENPELLEGRTALVESVAFHPSEPLLAAGHLDGTVRLWNLTTRTGRTLSGHERSVITLAFHPDGKTLATGSFDKTVRLWDVSTGRPMQTLTAEGPVRSIAFSPDGRTLAAANHAKTIELWNTETWDKPATLAGHAGPVLSFAFAPDGKTLISASTDGTLRWWDVASRACVRTIDDSPRGILAVRLTPDGRQLATIDCDASNNCRLCLRDGSDGVQRAASSINWSRMRSSNEVAPQHAALAISPDGMTVAAASAQESVELFDTTPRKQSE